MVKTPKTRHSKPQRDPVTIELEPGAVSRIADADANPDAADKPAEAQPAAEFVEAQTSGASDAPMGPKEPASGDAAAADADMDTQQRPYGYGFEAEEATRRESAEASPSETASLREQPAAVEPEPGRGGFSLVAAGFIGAAVALLGAGGLQYAGLLGAPGPTGAAPGLETVQAEVAALRQEIATLRDGGGAEGDLTGRVDGLATALDQVKADLAGLQQAAGSGDGDQTVGLQALDARINEIETAIAGLGQNGAQTPAAEIAAIGERITGLEALVKAAGDTATASEGQLGALEQTVTTLSSQMDAQAAQPKIAMAIATSALKAAVDRGAPFLAELETFAAVAPDAPEISELRAHAERGVATRDEILAETDQAAKAMIAADRTAANDAGFFERLLNSAESLVVVRPIGAVEGTGVPETVARMEVALNAGDLAAAIAELETLPETIRAAAGAFIEKVRNRHIVERLVDQAIAGAMKA